MLVKLPLKLKEELGYSRLILLALRLKYSERNRSTPWLLMCWARFNIKMSSYRYRKSHCGYKTILQRSYLHNGNPYTSKRTSLCWILALEIMATVAQILLFQNISCHGVDYAEYIGHCPSWRRISTTFAISLSRNDRNGKVNRYLMGSKTIHV